MSDADRIPDGGEVSVEDYSMYSISQLLSDSNWKARKAGYDRIIKAHSSNNTSELLVELEGALTLIPAFMKETLAAAFEPALEATLSIFRAVPSVPNDSLDCVTVAAVERGLVGRPRAVQVSGELLLMLVELGNGNSVVESLIKGAANKAPKVRLGSVHVLVTMVHDFGLFPGIPLKTLLKSVFPLCNDVDGKVRKESMNLIVEIYKFLGNGIRSFLGDLRDVQVQELEKEFATIDPTQSQPSRFVRGTERKVNTTVANRGALGSEPVSSAAGAAQVSLRDLHEPVAVLSKLPKTFFSVILDKSLKWQDRNAAIQENLIPLIKNPRLQKDDYTELTKAMRDLMTDSQLPLQVLGIRCIGDLCTGLGELFAPQLRFILPQLLDKFKEKKASHLEALHGTMNAMVTHVVGINDIVDEIENAASSKVPNQRQAVLQWVTTVIEKDPSEKNTARLQQATSFFQKLLGDDKAEVRDAAAVLVSTLSHKTGVEVANAGPEQVVVKPNDPPAKKKSAATRSGTAARTDSPSSIPNPRSAATPRSAASSNRGFLQAPSSASYEESTYLESQYTSMEECLKVLSGNVPDEIFSKLASKEWQMRKEGLNELQEAVASWSLEDMCARCDSVTFLLRLTPSWKDSNAQVCVSMMTLLTALAQRVKTKLSPRAGYHMIAGPVSRFSDNRSKSAIHELLLIVAEYIGPGFVIRHVAHNTTQNLKNIKISAEGAEFIETCIRTFGGPSVSNTKYIVELCKACFDQSNPQLKTAAHRVIVAAHRAGAHTVLTQLGEVKPHIRTALEAELGKTPTSAHETQVIPTRAVANGAAECDTSAPQRREVDGRCDISGTVNPSLLKQMTNAVEWKERMAAVKKVEDAVIAAKRKIATNGMTEALKALKLRLEEHNKNAVLDAVRTISVVVNALGPSGCRACAKPIIPAVMNLLGDQKPQIREYATKVVEECAIGGGIEMILPSLPKAMGTEVPHARQILVDVTVKCLEANPVTTPRLLSPIVPPLLRFLMDRSPETRAGAEQLLSFVARNVGYEQLTKNLTDLKPAEQQSIRALIDRYRDTTLPTQNVSVSGNVSAHSQPAESFNSGNLGRYPSSAATVTTANEMAATRGQVSGFNTVPTSTGIVQLTPNTEVYTPPSFSALVRNGTVNAVPITMEPSRPLVTSSSFGSAPQQFQAHAKPPAFHSSYSSGDGFPGSAPSFRESLQLIRFGALEHAVHQCTDWIRLLQTMQTLSFLTDPPQDVFTLLQALLDRLRVTVESSSQQHIALEKVLTTIQCALDRKDIVPLLSSQQLGDIIASVLERLLDERMHEAVAFVRALNSVMLKILENADLPTAIEALMVRLSTCTRVYLTNPTKVNHKFMELTVKCLLKISKRMAPMPLGDVERILMSQNMFLRAHPPSSFKDRDDLALRTVKTILHEIVKVTGPRSKEACTRLFTPNSLVGNFVDLCIQKMTSDGTGAWSSGSPTAAPGYSIAANNSNSYSGTPTSTTSTRTHSSSMRNHSDPYVVQANHGSRSIQPSTALSTFTPNVVTQPAYQKENDDQYISTIFAKIRKLNQTEQGLLELYNTMKQNPEIDISSHYTRCSDAFQTYIYRRLKKFLQEDITNRVVPENHSIRIPLPREQLRS